MGNYSKVLRQSNQLREIDPGQNRAHMFGNPYKLAKDQVQFRHKLFVFLLLASVQILIHDICQDMIH